MAACSSAARTSQPATTAPVAAGGPYDGVWTGQGTSPQGRSISISFTVRNNAITSFTYTYSGLNGTSCTGIDHEQIPPASQPRVSSGEFSTVFGDDLTASARFSSPASASGHILAQWQGRLNCSATIEANWNATRSPLPEQARAIAPASVAWCGKNVNCRDLLVQLLIFGLVNGAILALNAIGVTVIYSTVRILNLAHGDVFALTTALVTSTINIIGLNLSWPASSRLLILGGLLVAAIACGALLSMGVEALAFRPFRGKSKLAPLIASLGLSFILFQGAMVWRTYQKSFIRGEHRSVPGLPEVPTDGIPNFLPHTNLLAGRVVLQASDVFVWIAAILFVVVTTYILLRTRLGRTIRAVAQNEELAQMVGINREGAIRRAFALGGALAGAAAFVFALYYSRPFGSDGAESGLIAFAAALLGGIGSPIGALASGLLLGVLGSISDYFLTTQWTPILLLGLLTAILVWRRGGFAGEQVSEDVAVRDSIVLTAPAQNPRTRRWLVAMLGVLALLPIVTTLMNWSGQILLRGLGIFILLALGLNILLGVAGVLDLGYAISFALGGYVSAILTLRAPLDFIWVLLASAAVAGLFGLIKGSASLRLRGDYLAVATLALGLMMQQVIINGGDLTGRAQGLSTVPAPHILGLRLATPLSQYYLVFVIVLAAAFASGRLISSRTGRAWLASSEDETAAASLGVNAARYRQWAFVLSSALAGVAGALYASTFSYVDPDIAAFHVSAMLLAMVILGGAGRTGGAILGTALIYSYDKFIIPQLASLLALLWPQGVFIGMVPDIRGTNFFNFGIALYLTVLWRARQHKTPRTPAPSPPDETVKVKPRFEKAEP
jgi:branched-chain amino acid transport system permease protein